MIRGYRLCFGIVVCTLLASLGAQADDAARGTAVSEAAGYGAQDRRPISATDLKADLARLKAFIQATHPDVSHSASPEALVRAYAAIEAKLAQPMSRLQFWRELATLNPLFNDAHWSVTLPDPADELQRFVDAGGGLFPFEVHLSVDGEATVLRQTGGGQTEWKGARLSRINGLPSVDIVRALLALQHGDTPLLRANLAGPSFAYRYWKQFGAPSDYTLELSHQGKTHSLRLPAARQLPKPAAERDNFSAAFRFEHLSPKAALLTLGAFYWPNDAAIGEFTKQAFNELKNSGIDTLLIDIRENRGGDDAVWIDHVMPYLADTPYRTGSHALKKVVSGRETETDKAGMVVETEIHTWYQPQLHNPLRFKGKVYLLVGRRTYSSAVQFSNVMQDFGFATLVGESGYARSRSTGGVQALDLPHSGLRLTVPRFYVARPAGDLAGGLMRPDWLVQDSVLDERALIDAVLARSQRAGARNGLTEKTWIHGSVDCATNRDPAIDVYAFDADTYILRQNKCVHFEAPFTYILFGTHTVFIQDTGATADPSRFPLYETVRSLIARRSGKDLQILVAHSHSHTDHTAADPQFRGKPGVTLIEPNAKAVRGQFGFTNWPEGTATVDLGERTLVVIPTPGYQDEGITVYDPRTGWLLTGDNVYPGRVTVKECNAYRSSTERLAAFGNARPVSAVLGSHIEMSNAGKLFPPRSTYQPNEAKLALTVEDLIELKERLGQTAGVPAEIALKNLVVTPMGAFQRVLSNVLKWVGIR